MQIWFTKIRFDPYGKLILTAVKESRTIKNK